MITRTVTIDAPAHRLNAVIAEHVGMYPGEEVASITYLSETRAVLEFRRMK